jgi:hypothetical protein
MFSRDVLSMPDKWEYPWFAAWDLAFHMVPFSQIDPEFAKQQMLLFLREWYMHPNGQIPAYEFAFGDVNPPVHAWAAWRVYKITAPRGKRDTLFLERIFQKLLMNFTWWVNRKDPSGKNIFSGGFLGLDNIGVFDRSQPLPTGGYLEQADGTGWMAFYCLTMLSMALELAQTNPAYEDIASKFFEHFVHIADAINTFGDSGLWDDEDGFLLRSGAPAWAVDSATRAFAGWRDLALPRRGDRGRDAGEYARLQEAHDVVHGEPPRSGEEHLVDDARGRGRSGAQALAARTSLEG